MRVIGACIAAATLANAVKVSDCPGYKASNVKHTKNGLTADLSLAGPACNVYGKDLKELKLLVEHQNDKRLHVMVYDAEENVYQVQESTFPRPEADPGPCKSDLKFTLTEDPFSFTVKRKKTGEVLFDTSGEQLIFESQYVRLRTQLPDDPNLYGLGEHSDAFRLGTDDYTRTMWNAESPFIPRESNLYGSHPAYLEHRTSGSHGVFLLNSNGMDIKINKDGEDQQQLEYNTLGGVLDFYFVAGPSPTDVSKQFSQVLGLPAMMPYWTFGFQQCKYGYWDVNFLAEVVANYSTANIPLEALWSDIDHMDYRKDFTTDAARFPIPKMRELVHTLHDRGQKFVMMLDPGISRNGSYGTFARGEEQDAFLLADDGSLYRGVQWAGEVVWPDWLSSEAQNWWIDEMVRFFDPETGLDVDGLWNDMNEGSNFCPNTTCDPTKWAHDTNTPPEPENDPRPNTGRPIPGFPDDFQPRSYGGHKKGLPNRDLLEPKYQISNHVGSGALSDGTLWTNITNKDGTAIYDTKNTYGMTMVNATYHGQLTRRPGKRPFVLTRSSFAGTGTRAAHWFGDNNSTWDDYRVTMPQMLGFSAVHQMPMVGSDVCGFNGVAEENMCQRWTLLGAFQPFMRNHADISAPRQEFYLWDSVTKVAQKAIDARYRLIDYIYTAMHRSSTKGEPSVYPVFYKYPSDKNTFDIQYQYFYGDSILVSPVTDDDSKSVTFYLPDDVFYDFWTFEQVRGAGKKVTRDDVDWDDMPVHIKGGSIIPMRTKSANTTDELRQHDFTIVVAPGLDGKASGSLYLDDGESIDVGDDYSDIAFSWDGKTFSASGHFGYSEGIGIDSVVILGKDGKRVHKGDWSLQKSFRATVGQ